MKRYIVCLLVLLSLFGNAKAENISIISPSGKLVVKVRLGDKIEYAVIHESDTALAYSAISMSLSDGSVWGASPKLRKQKMISESNTIVSPIYKKSQVTDVFNGVVLDFKSDYALEFRAYDDGAAYRFVSKKKTPFLVHNETADFAFADNFDAWAPYVKQYSQNEISSIDEQFFNSFENTYTKSSLSELDARRLVFMPMLVAINHGKKVCITEANLVDYPGMYLNGGNGTKLKGVFARYPKIEEQGGHNMLQMIVKERENYIAKVDGIRNFPWRVVIVASNDAQLANSDMVYRLGEPSRIGDVSWIKPGKVAWDWWNDWGIFNVGFKGGINTATYKHYIDFASVHGVEYVILDEGWSVNLAADLMQVVPSIDLPAIIDYAKSKNVGIILWAGYKAFDKDIEGICRHYSQMGVKGFKVDFMDRDDQKMLQFYQKAAEVCAKYKMLVDFHGAFKPTGMQRAYPNIINYEGVHGLEQMKWSPASVDQVTYDVTIPFIRMVAGPMDYTQGAMRNAAIGNYAPISSEPMSQGTRCRQLALYVVLEAPLNMMCDSPDAYAKEQECTNFISKVPVVWDETVVLEGKVGEYIAIARRSGDTWYIGALTNWTPRTLNLDLSMLSNFEYEAEIIRDGANADKIGHDFAVDKQMLTKGNRILRINMAPGGGFVAVIRPVH